MFLVVSTIVLGLLYATNPNKKDFQQFIERTMEAHADDLPDDLNELLEQAGMPVNGLASMASMLTKRDDFIFFSTYELNIPGNRIRFLGIGKQFIPLELPNQ